MFQLSSYKCSNAFQVINVRMNNLITHVKINSLYIIIIIKQLTLHLNPSLYYDAYKPLWVVAVNVF